MFQPFWKESWQFFHIHIVSDPANPLLEIYPTEKIRKMQSAQGTQVFGTMKTKNWSYNREKNVINPKVPC